MSGDSNLGAGAHWINRLSMTIFGMFGPLVRLLKKDAYNPPELPAKAIANIFGTNGKIFGGKYFILDDEVKSSIASRNEKLQDDVWGKVSRDLDLSPDV